MPNKGIAVLFAGLAPVLVLQGLQAHLQGIQDRMVFVHRFVANITILTESEDFRPAFPSGAGVLGWFPSADPSPFADSPF